MKTTPPVSSIIEFPTPENGSAVALGLLPSIGSFPTRFDGEAYRIAVPAVVFIDIPEGVPINQVIAEAVEWVSAGEMLLYRDSKMIDGEIEDISCRCVPLASPGKLHIVRNPHTRARFLSMLIKAADEICESMMGEGADDPFEVEQAVGEIQEFLNVLILSGQPPEMVLAS